MEELREQAAIEKVAKAIEITMVEKTMHHPIAKQLPKIGWLYPIAAKAAIRAMPTPTAAAPDDGLMGRYREASRELVEAVRCADADDIVAIEGWPSFKRLAALSTATGDEAQQGEG